MERQGWTRAWTLQGHREPTVLQLEVKLGRKQERGRKEGREKLLLLLLLARKGKAERRGERGAQPFTLFSGQRTEYRLEAEEREKHAE